MSRHRRAGLAGLLLGAFILSLHAPASHAIGECGLSCCIAGATSSGVTLADRFGLSVKYEYMEMETIRDGTGRVSPDEVIDRNWQPGSSYSVPLDMTMEKLYLVGAVPVSARWQVLGLVPYVRNQMDMRNRMPNGMTMDMTMETVTGLGDVSVMGLYTAYTDAPIRPTVRLTLGAGIKAPTGSNTERGPSGNLVHAMMQPGSGSWDGLLLVNYMRAFYPLVVQANAFLHLTTEGDEGYEFGDQLAFDLITRYQVANYVNVGADLNLLHSRPDRDHDGKYSRPATSMVDNPANTGLTAAYLAPVVQAKIPNTGGSVEFKYQVPVYQDVRGVQQVVDWRMFASLTWNF
jgi:hypothetical protein